MPDLVQVQVLKGHEGQVWKARWNPAGDRVISCSGDKSIRLWSPEFPDSLINNNASLASNSLNWVCLLKLDHAHKRAVRSVSFEPTKGIVFASASFDGTCGIWDQNYSKEYECVTVLEGHENEVKGIDWSPSGNLLATCGRDKTIWVWEAIGDNEFECVGVLMEHTQDVKMLTWHPKEDILVSASYDDTIRIWKESEDEWYSSAVLSGHSSTVWAVDFDPTGNYIASCSEDSTVKIWSNKNSHKSEELEFHNDSDWECVLTIPAGAHSRAIYSLSWSHHFASPKLNSTLPDGSIVVENGYIATGGSDNDICIYKISSHLAPSSSITSQILTGPRNGLVDLSNYSLVKMEYQLVSKIRNAHDCCDINSVSWNPNPARANWLATSGDDDNVRIWHLSP
ncbi:putative cytosolic iron-sulfur protein assembly protein CIAO1-like protein [Smittium mucronatum]|uniref:Probable cytosolic iron-sulfur protein assembly protein 1 n=1 Tax=Smittium mucronatum TaxID=133383 RepID=A0A1R0H6Y3_9FUNG|nr:putative cytosolic iron-sulfur protein assembly protein CIAO1-like protein [Smittium mucronatum]